MEKVKEKEKKYLKKGKKKKEEKTIKITEYVT